MKADNLDFRKYNCVIPINCAHNIHSYTAKLIPQIPRYYIQKYSNANEIVLDPFCGSGTTLLEARLLSRNAVGIDINPLAVLISKVKTSLVDENELNAAIKTVKKMVKNSKSTATMRFPNVNYWFGKEAQIELSKIRSGIKNLDGKFDDSINNFLMMCFSSIIRKSSFADPRMAKTYRSKRVIAKIENGWVPSPIEYFEQTLTKSFEKIKSLSKNIITGKNFVRVFQGDVRDTSQILKQNGFEKIDFILTSPPYINAQDYFRSYKLELWWLGLATPEDLRNLNRQIIGTENTAGSKYDFLPKSSCKILNTILKRIWNVDKHKSYIIFNYFENMKSIFKTFFDLLKNNGHFCLITGSNTICGVQIPTYKILIQIAEDNGFRLVKLNRDKIKNRLLPPKRNHDGGVIKEEWITIFQRGDAC